MNPTQNRPADPADAEERILDVDVSGTSERLSPDAPVPVVDVATDDRRAGGAGDGRAGAARER